jgi:hypothetical protein
MITLRHFKQTEILKDQLARSARDARAKAWVLPAGAERDELLRRARRAAETAAHLDDWVNSPGLQPLE